MKVLCHAFAMCQSMFCAIPSPFSVWDEDARPKMLRFLPVIGLEIGVIWWAIAWLCRRLSLPAMVMGIVLCAWPYLATGFMHLDGFMDVTDAVKSWRSLERRREILKDSHVGSFSVISCCLLILAQFALLSSLKQDADLRLLLLIPVVSRCGSAMSVALLPVMETSQYAEKQSVSLDWVLPLLILVGAAACAFALWGKYGTVVLVGCVGYAIALLRAYRSLQGMNGDIAGFALVWSELAAIAALALL